MPKIKKNEKKKKRIQTFIIGGVAPIDQSF